MHSHRCQFKYYLNIYIWFLIKNLLKGHLRNTKGFFFSCDAHTPHIDGGFNISRARQSIPTPTWSTSDNSRRRRNMSFCFWYAWRCRGHRKCSQRNPTSSVCPDFLKLNSQSVHTFHARPTPRFQLRQTQGTAAVDWSCVGLSQTSCGRLFLSSHHHFSVDSQSFICFVSIVPVSIFCVVGNLYSF